MEPHCAFTLSCTRTPEVAHIRKSATLPNRWSVPSCGDAIRFWYLGSPSISSFFAAHWLHQVKGDCDVRAGKKPHNHRSEVPLGLRAVGGEAFRAATRFWATRGPSTPVGMTMERQSRRDSALIARSL